MINISILSQELDLGTLKFIKYCIKNKINIKYLLVAPVVTMHPIRLKQNNIRKRVFSETPRKPLFEKVLQFSRKNLIFRRAKQLLYKVILFHYKTRYKFKVESLKDNFRSNNFNCYDYLTVIYSLEGIVNPDTLKRFKNGMLNIHPAILPDYRGLDGGLWALKEGGELGVSAYIMNEGIDTGAIINTYSADKSNWTTLQEYLVYIKKLKYKSYVDAIKMAHSDKFKARHPVIRTSQNRGLMSENILKDLAEFINI
jgi:hypothetical protein